jgi:poly [ADP-ribose] polymerase
MANDSIQNDYIVSSDSVTQVQIDTAQTLLNSISMMTDVAAFNKQLEKLFSIIPRRMKRVSDHLWNGDPRNKANIIENEQSSLDAMSGQVCIDNKSDQTLLQAIGISMRSATEDEIGEVKVLIGESKNFINDVFTVSNVETESKLIKFNGYDTRLLWHGSRNQNWFNILRTGLLIRPTGVLLTGSMFGNGIYFADKAKKSLGYSSMSGSYWAHGSSDVGYLSLGRYLTVESANSSLDYDAVSSRGYNSVFAKAGKQLFNNEYIIYSPMQCTIKYIIEVIKNG